jgi:hypothetical protein
MTIGTREEAAHENAWSFLLSTIFTVVLALSLYYLYTNGTDFSITVFEFIILVLAAFRITRLLVYDSIALFIRDLFFDKKKTWNEKAGLYTVIREKPKKGIKRKIAELLCCPWCTGVWITLPVVFFFYLHPASFYVFVFLAVAGVATFVQLAANLIGWNAEDKKICVERGEKRK